MFLHQFDWNNWHFSSRITNKVMVKQKGITVRVMYISFQFYKVVCGWERVYFNCWLFPAAWMFKAGDGEGCGALHKGAVWPVFQQRWQRFLKGQFFPKCCFDWQWKRPWFLGFVPPWWVFLFSLCITKKPNLVTLVVTLLLSRSFFIFLC